MLYKQPSFIIILIEQTCAVAAGGNQEVFVPEVASLAGLDTMIDYLEVSCRVVNLSILRIKAGPARTASVKRQIGIILSVQRMVTLFTVASE